MAIYPPYPIDLVADTHAEVVAVQGDYPDGTTFLCKDEGHIMRIVDGVAVVIDEAKPPFTPIIISQTEPSSPVENAIWIKPT